MSTKAPSDIPCFAFPDSSTGIIFPFMKGDVVCDPMYPENVAWSCEDAAKCSLAPPSIEMMDTQTQWKQIENMQPVTKPAPVMDTTENIPCEDIKDKKSSDDIGAKDEWCSGGRVYKCTERAVSGARKGCSEGINKTTMDKGLWIPMRA